MARIVPGHLIYKDTDNGDIRFVHLKCKGKGFEKGLYESCFACGVDFKTAEDKKWRSVLGKRILVHTLACTNPDVFPCTHLLPEDEFPEDSTVDIFPDHPAINLNRRSFTKRCRDCNSDEA